MSCALAGVSLAQGPSESAAPGYPLTLAFVRDGVLQKRIELDALRRECGGRRIEVDDPYYARRKAFYACPLSELLMQGFGASAESLVEETFFLRARDGYTRQVSGARLFEPGAHLAFADAELSAVQTAAFASAPAAADRFVPVWEPIDRRQVDPGPFYMVWTGAHQNDPHRYPWPYQLATIEIGSFEIAFPHMLPRGAAEDSAAASGFRIFRRECMACHAINGEGGKVGPDLNVPMSIVEYRPVEQIKQFIREPARFRYTSMPPHLHLGPQELDQLVAYFEWMKTRKRDPGAPAS